MRSENNDKQEKDGINTLSYQKRYEGGYDLMAPQSVPADRDMLVAAPETTNHRSLADTFCTLLSGDNEWN